MVVVRSSSREVQNEVPSGLVDGANTTFSTAFNFRAGTTKLYLNGVRQRIGVSFDYVESGSNNLVFSLAPRSGDHILLDYLKG